MAIKIDGRHARKIKREAREYVECHSICTEPNFKRELNKSIKELTEDSPEGNKHQIFFYSEVKRILENK